MADPTPYKRSYSFTNYQADSPEKPLPGDRLDVELDNLAEHSRVLTDTVNAGFELDVNQEEIATVAENIDRVVFVADNINDVRGASDVAPYVEQASKLFLGAYPSPPSVGPLGQPIETGATYYDTALALSRVWDGGSWQTIASMTIGGLLQGTIEVGAGETVFDVGPFDAITVVLNGTPLAPGSDYTAESPNITVPGASAGDTIVYFGTLPPSNISSFGKSLVEAVTAAAARNILGLGAVARDSIVPVARGGTGAVNAASARDALNVPPNSRTIATGDGLTGGGNLNANRTLAVDNSVVRTGRTVSAGAGLTGGGNLSANRTIALGTPSNITATSTNNASGGTHTHAISAATIRELISNGGAGQVGQYAFCRLNRDADIPFGGTTAGSDLTSARNDGADGGVSMTGTWRCLGMGTRYFSTLWLRIS